MKKWILASFLVFSMQAFASQGPLTQLKGSTWQGTFEVFGNQGEIVLQFLPTTDIKGNLQYFHKVIGFQKKTPVLIMDSLVSEISQDVVMKDLPCRYTPRTVALTPAPAADPGEYIGSIHVYACTPDKKTEARLSQDPQRHANLNIRVKSFKLSQDQKKMEIIAEIDPLNLIEVTYQLTRTSVP